jgi:hypothetical protein
MAFKVIAKTLKTRTPIERAEWWFSYESKTWSGRKDARKGAFKGARVFYDVYGIRDTDELRLLMVGLWGEDMAHHVDDAIFSITGTEYGNRTTTIEIKADVDLIRHVVASSSLTVEDLRNSRLNRVGDYSQADIIRHEFYRPDRQALVAVGISREGAITMELDKLLAPPRFPNDPGLPKWQFIVPNGMRKPTGTVKTRDNDGKPRTYQSSRCNDNACLEESRRRMVAEMDYKKQNRDGSDSILKPSILEWEAKGITIKDAQVRVINHLLAQHPQTKLELVVDSGNVSLHWWLNVWGWSDEAKQLLMTDALKLGADPLTFRIAQWCRFPGGTRVNGDGRVARQEVLYFNPEASPKEKTAPGDQTRSG